MKRKIAFCLFGILFICAGFSVIAETPVMSLDDTSEQHAENITNILKASGLKKSFEQIRTESAYLMANKAEQSADGLWGMLFSVAKAFPFLIAGGILSIASRAYGMVSPWVYGALYNKRLEQALRIGEARLSLAPLVMPDASCGLALRLEF